MALPCLFLAVCASEPASENVTLSTYYPAPSGVYTKMVTTGDTMLARDGGSVSVGSASRPSPLSVNGPLDINDHGIGGSIYSPSPPGLAGANRELDITIAHGHGGDHDAIWIGPNVNSYRGLIRLYAGDVLLDNHAASLQLTGGKVVVHGTLEVVGSVVINGHVHSN